MARPAEFYRPAAFDDFDADTAHQIVDHLLSRVAVHRRLLELLRAGEDDEYVRLALGLTDTVGNYSAAEHPIHLGHRILEGPSSIGSVASFARTDLMCSDCKALPRLVEAAAIPWLKTSVGSEMMCMLRPDTCWITNKRTVYSYFLHNNHDDWERAADAIEAIAPSGDIGDTYDAWATIHPEIAYTLRALAEAGRREFLPALRAAKAERVALDAEFLWSDAIASMIYEWSDWEPA